MTNPKRPRHPGQDAEENPKVVSAFSPLDLSDSSFNQLSPELVMRKGRMGDAYIKTNRLTPQEVEDIVQLQNRLHIRFGEAAVRLGLLTEEEVQEVLDKQFNYASFGVKGKASKISQSLAILHAPGSEAAEAIKRLRSEVLVRLGEESMIAIAVLSPAKGEGKSHIAASLAIAFAQLNIKTLLIDANLRSPVQHKLFGIANQTGLSTILAKRSAKSLDAIPEIMPDFWVLGSGPLPPNPLEILSAPKFSELLDHFANQVSVFIIDTPPTTQSADAQMIARQTGRALFVARENLTKLAELKKAKNEMTAAGVDVLGTVYNQPFKHDGLFDRGLLKVLAAPLSWVWSRVSRSSKGDA